MRGVRVVGSLRGEWAGSWGGVTQGEWVGSGWWGHLGVSGRGQGGGVTLGCVGGVRVVGSLRGEVSPNGFPRFLCERKIQGYHLEHETQRCATCPVNVAVSVADPCGSRPCRGGGTCVAQRAGGYTCVCPPYYGGVNCTSIQSKDHTGVGWWTRGACVGVRACVGARGRNNTCVGQHHQGGFKCTWICQVWVWRGRCAHKPEAGHSL